MHLEFIRMSQVDNAEYIALNTNPLVRRQMPLTDDSFGEKECQEWVAGKEKQWDEHGYGPWAFLIDEYHFVVHPIIAGKGPRLFETDKNLTLKLVGSKTFRSGVVALHYKK